MKRSEAKENITGKNDSFDRYKISNATSNVKKKIVEAHNTNFSNVKKIETNGFQHVDQTKKRLKVKKNTLSLSSGVTFLDDVLFDINEMGRKSQKMTNSAEINGLGTKIRTTISVPPETITLRNNQGRIPHNEFGKTLFYQ